MSRGNKERANESGERYLKGRTAGVEGTYGEPHKGVAERTVVSKNDMHDSGGEDGLPPVAKSIYDKAVRNGNGRDPLGDQALHER
jgi:hypothetical protein